MNTSNATNLTDFNRWFRYWMPYVFQKLDGNIYLPLNRDQKPLGIITGGSVNNAEFAKTHGVRFSRNPATFTGVWYAPDHPLEMYDDNPTSRTDYFQRFERLMEYTVKTANRDGVESMSRIFD